MEIIGVGVSLEIAVTSSIFELSVKGFGIKWKVATYVCDTEIKIKKKKKSPKMGALCNTPVVPIDDTDTVGL